MNLSDLLGHVSEVLGGEYYNSEKDYDMEWQQAMQYNQNQFNLKQWDLNNQYNTPANQIQRLKAAGLSGAAAAQTLTGGNSNAPVTASNMPSAPDQNSLGSLMGGIKDFTTLAKQMQNLDADTREKNANANRNEKTLIYDINKLISENDEIQAETNKIRSEMLKTDEERKNLAIMNKYADQKNEQEIGLIKQKRNLLIQQVENMSQEERKLAWENFYRYDFGIDPHDPIYNQLVTASLDGKIEPVWNAFEKETNFIFDKLSGYFNGVRDYVDEKWNEFKENYQDSFISSPKKYTYNHLGKPMINTAEYIPNRISNYMSRGYNSWQSRQYYLHHGHFKSKGHSYRW